MGQAPRFVTKELVSFQQLYQGMGIQQDRRHDSASQLVSRGLTMSPFIEAEPLRAPKRVSGLLLAGISWLMGTPFFVINTASPVAATSSMIWRHFALNSEALMVLINAPV